MEKLKTEPAAKKYRKQKTLFFMFSNIATKSGAYKMSGWVNNGILVTDDILDSRRVMDCLLPEGNGLFHQVCVEGGGYYNDPGFFNSEADIIECYSLASEEKNGKIAHIKKVALVRGGFTQSALGKYISGSVLESGSNINALKYSPAKGGTLRKGQLVKAASNRFKWEPSP